MGKVSDSAAHRAAGGCPGQGRRHEEANPEGPQAPHPPRLVRREELGDTGVREEMP